MNSANLFSIKLFSERFFVFVLREQLKELILACKIELV